MFNVGDLVDILDILGQVREADGQIIGLVPNSGGLQYYSVKNLQNGLLYQYNEVRLELKATSKAGRAFAIGDRVQTTVKSHVHAGQVGTIVAVPDAYNMWYSVEFVGSNGYKLNSLFEPYEIELAPSPAVTLAIPPGYGTFDPSVYGVASKITEKPPKPPSPCHCGAAHTYEMHEFFHSSWCPLYKSPHNR